MRFMNPRIFLISVLLVGCGNSTPPVEAPTPIPDDTAVLPDTAPDAATTPDAATPIPPKEENAITIVEATDENVYLAPGEELPAQLLRTFDCRPEQVGPEMVLAEVPETDGDRVLIRPAGDEACQYDLVVQSANGEEHLLSGTDVSGYLFTVTQRDVDGVTVACVNNIRHHPLDGVVHEIDQVGIDCAAQVNGLWTPLQPVVTPDGPWAAWIRQVTPHESLANHFRLTFAHDFSFQFMNLTDNGRPDEDGLYEVVFEITTEGIQTAPAAMVSETQNPLAGGEFTEWNPTPQEEIDYAEFMTMGDGPCPNGCPIEDEEDTP